MANDGPDEDEAELKESGAISDNKAAADNEAHSKEPRQSGTAIAHKPKSKGGETKNPIAEAAQFLKEVKIEFHKISWPTLDQVLRETWAVLFLVATFTVMVLAFDWALSNGVFGPLEHWARLHGGGIGKG